MRYYFWQGYIGGTTEVVILVSANWIDTVVHVRKKKMKDFHVRRYCSVANWSTAFVQAQYTTTVKEKQGRGQPVKSGLPGKWPLKRFLCTLKCNMGYDVQ